MLPWDNLTVGVIKSNKTRNAFGEMIGQLIRQVNFKITFFYSYFVKFLNYLQKGGRYFAWSICCSSVGTTGYRNRLFSRGISSCAVGSLSAFCREIDLATVEPFDYKV